MKNTGKSIKDKIKSIIEDLFNGGDGLENDKSSVETSIMTLMTQVEEEFEKGMKLYSWKQIIQFPMVFDILLCPQDYELFKQAIPGILPQLISDFYGIIKKRRDQISGSVVSPTNKYWQFRYSACQFTGEAEDEIEIMPGQIITKTMLFSDDIRTIPLSGGGDGRETQTRTSVRSSRSSITGKAINLEILRGGTMLANRVIIFDFDHELNQELKTIKGRSPQKSLASLTWKSDVDSRKSSQPFLMKENTLIISGPKDVRDNPSGIMKINMNQVETDHVHIRYSETENTFQVCAFADGVRVDEVLVPVSKSQNSDWKPLKKESEIIIRDSVTVFFMVS